MDVDSLFILCLALLAGILGLYAFVVRCISGIRKDLRVDYMPKDVCFVVQKGIQDKLDVISQGQKVSFGKLDVMSDKLDAVRADLLAMKGR